MLPSINPTTTAAWKALEKHFEEMKSSHMKDLFAADAERFNQFSLCAEDIVFDYSKNIITEK